MKTCAKCQSQFEVTDEDRQFYDRVSPVFSGQKFTIPEPKLCPACRQQRRLAFCNERNLYPSECQMCHKRTLSEHPPTSKVTVYCRECWHSDKWDAKTYGREVDFSRPIFDQIHELKYAVPSQALNVQGTLENSDYIHYAGSCRNCYLIMHADFCENCMYGYGMKKCLSCMDGYYNLRSELCYDSVDINGCYGLVGSQDCLNCSNSYFIKDCVGCRNCFLCVGLRQAEYCFENQQLTREQYEQKMKEIDFGSRATYDQCQERLASLAAHSIFKEYKGYNTYISSGNHLVNCKNAQFCYDCEDLEDAKFCCQIVLGAKNIYDIDQYGTNLQESYECAVSGENSYHLLFTDNGHMSCSDLIYCYYMESSKNCFGCVNMASAQYCIFNKQYTKEQYEELLPRIISHMQSTGEWGEFFPARLSYFGYNKTTAHLFYPLSREQAAAQGFYWDDYENPKPDATHILSAAQVPDHINDISDDIINTAIECASTGKLFKINSEELKFYRQHHLPLPVVSPNGRFAARFARRNPRHLWIRSCAKCQKQIQTTYSPERPEAIYCEVCYNREKG